MGFAGTSLMLGPDGFFDGAIFDPDGVEGYVENQTGTRRDDVQ